MIWLFEMMQIEISTSGRSISPKIASFGNLFAFSSHLFLHKYIGDICSKSDTWGLLQLPLPVNWGDSILPSSPRPQLSNRDPKLPCFWTIFSTTLSSLWGLVWTFFINPDFRTRPSQLWCENIVLSEEAAQGVNCQVRGGSEGASEPGAGPRWKQGASGLNIKDPLRQQTGRACSQDQHRYTCEWLQRHFEEDLAWNQTVSNLWWQAWNVLHMIWNNSILSSVFKSVTVVVEICSPKSRISCQEAVPWKEDLYCEGQLCWAERSLWDTGKAKSRSRLEFPPQCRCPFSFGCFLPCPLRAGGEEADIRASHPSDKRWMRRWKRCRWRLNGVAVKKVVSQKGRTAASIHSCCQASGSYQPCHHCPRPSIPLCWPQSASLMTKTFVAFRRSVRDRGGCVSIWGSGQLSIDLRPSYIMPGLLPRASAQTECTLTWLNLTRHNRLTREIGARKEALNCILHTRRPKPTA